jgi:hypothetical protein
METLYAYLAGAIDAMAVYPSAATVDIGEEVGRWPITLL